MDQVIEVLGCWEGFSACNPRRLEPDATRKHAEVWIELIPDRGHKRHCSACGHQVYVVHDYHKRHIRDLPILDAQTHLHVHLSRVECSHCGGPKLEHVEWLSPYSRITKRFAEAVARLCQVLPVKHVAEHFCLGWHTVKAIDKAYLQETLEPLDLSDVTVLCMDEFAIHKGHRYATVVMDPLRKRVLWVGNGRSRKDVAKFFELLGVDGCKRIKAVVMDMSTSFELEVRKHCPAAEVVFDLFHVVAKYGREVIDRVRVDEANRLREDKPARKVVKSARWLLLRNAENVTKAKDQVKLRELLKANKALMAVYILKDELKQLWACRNSEVAIARWLQWHRKAMYSGIKTLEVFAKRLLPYLQGIIAHSRWPLHTSLIEGVNNRIKVIKRMGYGFRDEEYFFLKIRAAYPGITR
ncbi:ISL3 family transposase [bacterium]|nr:ISL3 family transposase [bacterium]